MGKAGIWSSVNTEKDRELVSDAKGHVSRCDEPPVCLGAQSNLGLGESHPARLCRPRGSFSAWPGLAASGTGRVPGPVTELVFPGETREPAGRAAPWSVCSAFTFTEHLLCARQGRKHTSLRTDCVPSAFRALSQQSLH